MRALLALMVLVLLPVTAGGQTAAVQRPGMPPPRDNSRPPAATGTSRIRGRIVAADTGQPIRRALVRVIAPELRENRSTSTDEQGRYQFSDLPAGRYSVMASKSGFVSLNYGQLRPLEQGKPVPLGENEMVERIDLRLPRGGVITGRVVDEYGEPVATAMVMALQFRFMNGQRRPMNASNSSMTPDNGEFRLWGLGPGEFVISATLRDQMNMMNSVDDSRSGYAPTYYPGTANVAEAQRLTLAVGASITDVTITLAPARTAKVSGSAVDADGHTLSRGFINLMPRDPQGMMMGGPGGQIAADGTFTLSGVTPGIYILRGNVPSSGGMAAPLIVQAEVTVDGQDIAGIRLAPITPVTVRGRLVIDPASAQTLHPNAFRVSARPKGDQVMMMAPIGPPELVKEDGSFEFKAMPGAMLVQLIPAGPTTVWLVKSMRVGSADITDAGVDFKAGQDVDDLEIEITGRVPILSGTVTTNKGVAAADYTVIAFPQDSAAWGTQAAGRVAVARPDSQGTFQIKSLRPGAYYVVAVEYVEPGQWTDPEYLETLRGRATRLALGDAETRTMELKLHADR